MCGISGILNLAGTKESYVESVKKMISAVNHRGPDDSGYYHDDHIGLGHARLSIIDLQSGKQPIHNEKNNIWVIFNGEIFNYLELRAILKDKGHRFYTNTDTEVIVHLYEQYGNNFVSFLNGQFAIALWDTVKKKLILVRDRVGIAPLFYKLENNKLFFGSEIKSILAVAQHLTEINPLGLDQLFTFWSPVSPNTLFKDIFEVSPGQIIEIKDGDIKKSQYWDWEFPVEKEYRSGTEEDLSAELLEKLINATQIRLRSDVPVGAYLSGGLDSSALVALIKNHSDAPLRTFSIKFDDSGLDESGYQNEMIEHVNADHSSIICSSKDIASNFEDVIWHAESPVLRTAPVPMKMLSKLVHDQGFKVVLTGEGSDEVLGGYDIFKEAKIRQFWAKSPDSKFRPFLLKRLYPYLDLTRGQEFLQDFFGASLDNADIPWFSHLPRWDTTARIKDFYSEEFKERINIDAYNAIETILPQSLNKWNSFNRSQYIEAKTLMPGYLLSSQGDRMLMANSVEGRFPFLDHRLIEFANSLDPRLKMKVLNEKYLLKKSMASYLPSSIISRYKQPYRAPDIPTFLNEGKLIEFAKRALDEQLVREYGYFNEKKITRLVKKIEAGKAIGYKDNMAFVGILSVQIWHKMFLNNSLNELTN